MRATRSTARAFQPSWRALARRSKAGCSTALKLVCVVASAAYLFLGIDEIGLQIEQPFFVMPVHALAEGLTRDVVEELSHN